MTEFLAEYPSKELFSHLGVEGWLILLLKINCIIKVQYLLYTHILAAAKIFLFI